MIGNNDLESANISGKIAWVKELTFQPENENLILLGFEITYFNDAGNIVRWEVYHSDGRLTKTLIKAYNANHILIEDALKQTDGKYFSQNLYSDDGVLLEKQYDYGQGVSYKEIYDKDGNVIRNFENEIELEVEEEVNEDPYNEQWDTKEVIDHSGKKVRTTYYYSFNRLFDITQSTFDKDGKLMDEKVFASEEELENDNFVKMDIYTYDPFGNLTRKKSNNKSYNGGDWITIHTNTFHYDSQNNWVEKQEIMNNKITDFKDKLQFVRRREIQYLDEVV
ncbi:MULTISPECIES: hypothetical protein [unclassified Sphingobacterium]|uniref:hypothetical protein n=1 Tax=unclassified Sphingobacterium TaxID=2609468 RepID=UPI0025E589CF|nr:MULTISPECIES: hypothetical protein [unclassified Sphingobacterium]